MKHRIISLLVFLTVAGCSHIEKEPELVSLSGAMQEEEAKLTKEIMGFDLLRKVKLGAWECYAPNENLNAMLFCTYEGKMVVIADNTDGLKVSIPQTKENISFITATDKETDGSFDTLYYDGLSADGQIERIVFDENIDGNIDKILDIKQSKLMLNINGVWYETKNAGKDKNGKYMHQITINGKLKRVILDKYPYKLVEF